MIFPSQGTSQLQVLRHRLRPNYWPPQGFGGSIIQFGVMAYEPANWLNAQLQKRIPTTIKLGQVPTTLTDFPVLIHNIFSELIGAVETELRFASTDDIQLEYEIEKFDTITGELIAWIKKPTVSDGDIIYIYFDNLLVAVDEQNPAGVWSNNYVAVYHMNQPSGNTLDSTKFHNDMSPVNSPINATGQIGAAKEFPANSDAYTILDNNSLDTTDITVSAWIKLNSIGGFQIIASKWFFNIISADPDWIFLSSFGNFSIILNSEPLINTGEILSTGVTYHVAFVIVGATTLNMYLDGELVHTQAINPKTTSSTGDLQITNADGSSLLGIEDELHMSNDGKSADWIKTEYNNQKDFDTFFTTGAVENVPTVFDTMVYEPINWLNAQLQKRISVTINGGEVPTTLTDFPLLINETFPELIGSSIPQLRFASTDDIQLEYEIEKFDTITGELIAWIKKPTVSDGDIIYIYYDNSFSPVDEQDSTAVWSNNFVVVQHLAQPSGNILDSTKNNNDMAPVGTPINATLIGNAKEFPTTNDGYIIPANDTLNTTDITVVVWVHPTFVSGIRVIAAKAQSPSSDDWLFAIVSGELSFNISNNPPIVTGTILNNTTYHIAFTIVGLTTLNIYLNGDLIHTQAITAKNTSSISSLELGALGGGSAMFGIIDQLQMSNVGKSADWIKTTYNNQRPDSNTFFTIGVEENVPTVFDIMRYE